MNDTDPRRSDAPVPAARTRGQALDFRPTLFGEEAPGEAGAGTDGLRILGSLQSPPAPRRGSPRGRWILGGLLAAALMASGGLALRHAAQATDAAHGEGGGPAAVDTDLTARHPSSAGPAASMPAVPASAWPPAPAASMGEVELPPAAARIEADTPSAARDPFAGLAPTPTPTQAQAQAQARTQAADSTTELLQRCDAVGGLEGVLCRWRICADRWGQDPACPKNTQRPYREPS
ncbi:MAG: hypothetical protein EPO12_12940 [Aquabacterium sp.]|nr:MAG: hypothetical protein EPO12_12940 [Aquabacterium sp.]